MEISFEGSLQNWWGKNAMKTILLGCLMIVCSLTQQSSPKKPVWQFLYFPLDGSGPYAGLSFDKRAGYYDITSLMIANKDYWDQFVSDQDTARGWKRFPAKNHVDVRILLLGDFGALGVTYEGDLFLNNKTRVASQEELDGLRLSLYAAIPRQPNLPK